MPGATATAVFANRRRRASPPPPPQPPPPPPRSGGVRAESTCTYSNDCQTLLGRMEEVQQVGCKNKQTLKTTKWISPLEALQSEKKSAESGFILHFYLRRRFNCSEFRKSAHLGSCLVQVRDPHPHWMRDGKLAACCLKTVRQVFRKRLFFAQDKRCGPFFQVPPHPPDQLTKVCII